jgi:N-acetylglucosamine repressor
MDGTGLVYSLPELSPSIWGINRARIISLIRRRPGTTRTELAQLSGLSKGTISNHVGELLEEGMLYEEQAGQRQRNIRLRLNRDAGRAIGVELWPGECRGVLTDMAMRPLKQVEHQLLCPDIEGTIDAIVSISQELLAGVEETCVGLVVGLPGVIDAAAQTLVYSESLGWSDLPLAQRLTERLPYPVSLINRVRAGALGEHWHGAGLDVDDMAYVSLSSGIAVGVLIGGQLFTGAFGSGGELGHTTVLVDGKECVCGNRGCLETVASVPVIIEAIQERLQSREPSVLGEIGALHYTDVIAAVKNGDSLATQEVKRAARFVGIAVANLINLFNPRLVIIGGQLAEAGETVVNTIRNTAQRKAFPLSYSGVEITKSALGMDSGCIGACALAVDQYIAQTYHGG